MHQSIWRQVIKWIVSGCLFCDSLEESNQLQCSGHGQQGAAASSLLEDACLQFLWLSGCTQWLEALQEQRNLGSKLIWQCRSWFIVCSYKFWNYCSHDHVFFGWCFYLVYVPCTSLVVKMIGCSLEHHCLLLSWVF